MRFFWKISWYFANFLFKLLFGFEVKGRENIPYRGSLIIASNHISYLDPPILGAAATREVHFVAKEGLFKWNRFFSWLIEIYNAIPIRREGGNHSAIKTFFSLLKGGKAIVIFPEGTRSKTGELLPVKQGVGFLALNSGATVLPAFIFDSNAKISELIIRKKRIRVIFGDLMKPDDKFYETFDKESYKFFSEEVIKRIQALREMWKG